VSLDEPLAILDLEWRPEMVCAVPATGRVVKTLDRK